MNSTLQELTDKIYNEGVVKAQTEASSLIEKAKQEAAEIVEKAKQEAENIKENATKEANTLRKNTESEIKLYADQAVNALKTTITDVICDKVTGYAVGNASEEKEFMQGIIAKIAEAWIKDGNVTIQTSDAESLKSYFAANAKNILEGGLTIEEVKGLKTSFSIAPANGGYKINIGNEEFIAYFKEFLRPALKELLF